MAEHPTYILTVSCPDRRGIVSAVAGYLAGAGCNIIDSAQFGDPETLRFFMRVAFEAGAGELDAIREGFAGIGRDFAMDWQIHDAARKPRVLIMVSRFGHCLNDLLHRTETGQLPIEIPVVVSNHSDFYRLVAHHGVPFHHLPVTKDSKARQEAKLRELIAELEVDLVVLARYMQILSPELAAELSGRCINIHHSFLPSFKGAKPYHQAYERGVKLIGATAHYVTADLDEGPIIEQQVDRVDHRMTPQQLASVGQDLECKALVRALQFHIEHRVFLNGRKTVVFG